MPAGVSEGRAGGGGGFRARRRLADGPDRGRAGDARPSRPDLQDFDIYEIHEAFAAQVLCTLRAWESEDYCRTGSACPARWAASTRPRSTCWARRWRPAIRSPRPARASSATVAKELAERGGGRALVSICTAGGMGVVAIVER
jgi:acetyl-CoA C-acetyltransferase